MLVFFPPKGEIKVTKRCQRKTSVKLVLKGKKRVCLYETMLIFCTVLLLPPIHFSLFLPVWEMLCVCVCLSLCLSQCVSHRTWNLEAVLSKFSTFHGGCPVSYMPSCSVGMLNVVRTLCSCPFYHIAL